MKTAHAERPENQASILPFAQGSTYSPELLRLYEVFWVVSASRPFSIVNDEWFIRILEMFNPQVERWSGMTIGRDVREFFKIGQKNLAALIAVS